MDKMVLPKYYWTDDFLEFEDYIREWGQPAHYSAGELIYGIGLFPHMCYVERGLARFFVLHDSGKERTIYYTGPGSLCVGYSPPTKYKLEHDANQVSAITDVDVLVVPQEKMPEMMRQNYDFHLRMTDHYVKFINLMLFSAIDSAFNDTFERVCNFLHIYLSAVGGSRVRLTQDEIASTIGTSRMNLFRALSRLRDEGVVRTGRNSLDVLNREQLAKYCSWDVLD